MNLPADSITKFYMGKSPDNAGRNIMEIWSYSNMLLENIHDYIQWLFPLREESAYNPFAPLLSDGTLAEFHANTELQERMLTSFKVMLKFYGFEISEEDGGVKIAQGEDFVERKEEWLTPHNHNYVRITRILTCLNLIGLGQYAGAFLDSLEEVYQEDGRLIGPAILQAWRSAGKP